MRRRRLRVLVAVAVAVAATCLSGRASGAGGIETDGSTWIAAGEAFRRGAVVLDACTTAASAPTIASPEAPDALGDPPVPPPAVDAGPGGPAIDLTVSQTLPGGVYDCDSFNIRKNVVVTYSGAVTIRSRTTVTVAGTIQSGTDDAHIVLRAGGSVQIGAVNAFSGISAVGARSDVVIESGATVSNFGAPRPSLVRSAFGSVRISAATIRLTPSGAWAGRYVDLSAAGEVYLWGSEFGGQVVTSGADATIRSSGGTVEVTGCDVAVGGRLTVRAGAAVRAVSASVRASGGFDATAFGGRVDVSKAFLTADGATGECGLRGRDGVVVSGRASTFPPLPSRVETAAARLVVESTSGGVELGVAGASADAGVLAAPAGEVVVRAAGSVRLHDAAGVVAASGVRVASGAELRLATAADVGTTVGAVRLDAAGAIVAAGARVHGGSVAATSGSAMALGTSEFAADAGGLQLTSGAPLQLRGTASARGALALTTIAGGADLRGAAIRTTDSASGTGRIDVASHGADAAVLLHGATLRSGDASGPGAASGDVAVRVHAPGEALGAHLVPRDVRVRQIGGTRDAAFAFVGWVDAGTGGQLADGPAGVAVGGVAATTAEVVLGRSATSRRRVRVVARGPFADALDAAGTGDLRVELRVGDVVAGCVAHLRDGRFRAPRRGRVVTPSMRVVAMRGTLEPGGAAKIRCKVAFDPERLAASCGGDFVVSLGGAGPWRVPRSVFVTDERGRSVAVAPLPGLHGVVIDARTSCTSFVVSVPLGATVAGVPLDVEVSPSGGPATRTRLLLARRGDRLVY